jgi:hypothetical protein
MAAFLKNPFVVDALPVETATEKARRRRKEKKEAWQKELNQLHDIRERRIEVKQSESELRRRAELDAELAKAQSMLRSQRFKVWFETTTGDPVEPWAARFLITEHAHRQQRGYTPGYSLLDWIYDSVRHVADNNPWSNPYLTKQWAEELQHVKESRHRRRILMNLATPKWVRREHIEPFYRESATRSITTGIPHHVDHIVPIVHRRVCGLNVPANLRVIPASENMSKGNRFTIGG